MVSPSKEGDRQGWMWNFPSTKDPDIINPYRVNNVTFYAAYCLNIIQRKEADYSLTRRGGISAFRKGFLRADVLYKGSESEVGPALSHELHPTLSHPHRSHRSLPDSSRGHLEPNS